MSVCVNNVALIGNLTKDPEARVFDDGNKIVHLGLALNEVANGKEYTTFLDIELRGLRRILPAQGRPCVHPGLPAK